MPNPSGPRDALIIDAVRTPVGRHGGALAAVRPDDLLAVAIKALVERTRIPAGQVEDVIMGCTNQAGEDNRNVARMSSLLAGLPVDVAGQTVNRLCGSGLQAIVSAGHAIAAGEGDVFIAGGTESMSRAPFVMLKPEQAYSRGRPKLEDSVLGWRFVNPKMPDEWTISLGETAEVVAERYGITREEQDRIGLDSQRRAATAIQAGRFAEEITPVVVPQRKGPPLVFDTDEHPRPDASEERLAALKPAFKEDGTVTAGNASGLNDGAAALLIVSREKAEELGLSPMARIVGSAVAGVEPECMGIGPIPATQKVLSRTGLAIDEIDLVELNEAFAAQAAACIRELGLDWEKTNVNGGAIALGHPLGCTGARLMTSLVHEMRRREARYGLCTMCIGVGQGISTVVESEA
ncbi:MAG: beta-ketoadipyl CoA thiolase [Gemmatimonas sp. SG8_38_2]|nr:MAG: beta-ketoadipyl CoA thiolase [Gemmatimonas sp. SG8_38_2]